MKLILNIRFTPNVIPFSTSNSIRITTYLIVKGLGLSMKKPIYFIVVIVFWKYDLLYNDSSIRISYIVITSKTIKDSKMKIC